MLGSKGSRPATFGGILFVWVKLGQSIIRECFMCFTVKISVSLSNLDLFIECRDNAMAIVPASRADIFRDRSLSLPDKRFLMRFFKLVTDYTESQDGMVAGLTAEDLESPFIELLKKQQLPSSIQE